MEKTRTLVLWDLLKPDREPQEDDRTLIWTPALLSDTLILVLVESTGSTHSFGVVLIVSVDRSGVFIYVWGGWSRVH